MDHEELIMAPSVKICDHTEESMHVQCIVDEEFYEVERPGLQVLPQSLFAVEDLLQLLPQD